MSFDGNQDGDTAVTMSGDVNQDRGTSVTMSGDGNQDRGTSVTIFSGGNREGGTSVKYASSEAVERSVPNLQARFEELQLLIIKHKMGEHNYVQLLTNCSRKLHIDVNMVYSDKIIDNIVHFTCTLTIEGIVVAQIQKRSKREAKMQAFKIAVNKIMSENLKVIQKGKNFELKTSLKKLTDNSIKASEEILADRRIHFVLWDYSATYSTLNSVSILHDSAQGSHLQLEYENDDDLNSQTFSCHIKMGGLPVGSGKAGNKADAKTAAVNDALQYLRKHSYTIKVKGAVCGDIVSRELIMSENKSEDSSNDNVWAEDATDDKKMDVDDPTPRVSGRHGGDPCDLSEEEVKRRLEMQQFEAKLDNAVRTFLRAGYIVDDLIFNPEFSPDERRVIHRYSDRRKLKLTNHGEDNAGHLVLSCKHKPRRLLEILLATGVSSKKYTVIPPILNT